MYLNTTPKISQAPQNTMPRGPRSWGHAHPEIVFSFQTKEVLNSAISA